LIALNNFCLSGLMRDRFLKSGLILGRILILESVADREHGVMAKIDIIATLGELEVSPQVPMYEADPLAIHLGRQPGRRLSESIDIGMPLFSYRLEDHRL
jgi:hypothetical protein